MGFPGGAVVKNPPANAGTAGNEGLIPGWLGRSPGIENSNTLQNSYLENSIDRGAWWATDHWAAKSDTTEHMYACTHAHTHTHTQSGNMTP